MHGWNPDGMQKGAFSALFGLFSAGRGSPGNVRKAPGMGDRAEDRVQRAALARAGGRAWQKRHFAGGT